MIDDDSSTPSLAGVAICVALLVLALIVAVRIRNDRRDCLDAGGTFILSALPLDRYCISSEVVITP